MVAGRFLRFLWLASVCGVSARPGHFLGITAPRQTSTETVAASDDGPTVDLGYATYRGIRLDDAGVDEYLGMRYAQAPLGNLRFRAPQDPLTETGISDATQLSVFCAGANEDPSDPTISEDCLFANVFTPSNATADSKLPVWVFIQGGGYAVIRDWFNGTEVIQKSGGNIVYVNFNYRVGALGFLASERVREDGDLNAGLLDQRKLLHWVQTHIEKFGGDPNHVVIHGPSAGSGSVAHHLAAYNGKDEGLFVGAIAQNSFWPTQRSVSEMEFLFDQLLNDTGCASSNRSTGSDIACLRSADLATIQKGNVDIPFPGNSANPLPLWSWLPVTEGEGGLVTANLYDSFETGHFVKAPLLVGNVNDEGTVFVTNASTPAEVSAFLKANYPNLNEEQLSVINEAYPLMAPLPRHAAYFPSLAAAYGENTFTCPGNALAGAMARFLSADQVWNYRFNVQDPDNIAAGFGVPHVLESAAIFGPGNSGGFAQSYLTTNAAIVPVTMMYAISFVRSLDPNTYKLETAPTWEAWGEIGRGSSLWRGGFGHERGNRLKLQTNTTAMEQVPQDQAKRCMLWKHLSDTTQQ